MFHHLIHLSSWKLIDFLKNRIGKIVYPKTVTKAVYDIDTGERLDNKLNNIGEDIVSHKADNVPHQYGNRFAWEYNSITDSLDLVVIE